MTVLQRCARCILPETHETIMFNKEQVCNICEGQTYKTEKIDWTARKSELTGIIANYKNKNDYDCIVPFSGGKDSTWTLYYLVKEYQLRPLVVCFDHGFLRSNLKENTLRTLRTLGVDYLQFTPNWHLVRKLMLQSLKDKGDFCWHCHTGIASYPMRLAVEKSIPLVVWGEPSAEYTAYFSYDEIEENDESHFNRFTNLGISAADMWIRLNDASVQERELKPFTYPNLKDLIKVGVRSICLGSYVPWDTKKQSAIIQQELGWKGDSVENVPPQYSYEKIECYMQGVRDYIKFIKRGYTRPTHLATIDIRNHRLSRDEALKMIGKFEGKRPPSLDIFLKYLELTEEEFMKIVLQHQISPWKYENQKPETADRAHDYNEWVADAETRSRRLEKR